MIDIQNLRKVYQQGGRDVVAVDDVSLHVPEGAVVGVLGQSGAGKSTLIRCVNMLERPTSGTVQVAGQELTTLDAAGLRTARQRIGMIFQHFNLLSSRTVAANIAFPLEVVGVARAEREQRVRDLLGLVGLSERADAYPAQLSGGQKQRVGIARALAAQPRVLLSDEATSALDPETTHAILTLLRDLNQRLGLTILLITHEMHVVKQICDQVAVMSDGRIIESGRVEKLIATPGSRLAQAFFPLADAPQHTTGALVAITFTNGTADQPVLSSLAREFGVDVNILGGSIETLRDGRVGRLQAEIRGERQHEALKALQQRGLGVEKLR